MSVAKACCRMKAPETTGAPSMSNQAENEALPFGIPEMEFSLPCQACAARQVFTALAPPGARETALYLRCCACGTERRDLADYYGALA